MDFYTILAALIASLILGLALEYSGAKSTGEGRIR